MTGERVTCENCEGRGEIVVEVNKTTGKTEVFTCPVCKGDGLVNP